jgi:hypothetical protein
MNPADTAIRRLDDDIVLFIRAGSQKITFTATQLRDTVASYLARGHQMPTPTDINDGDPYEPLHIITEEWLYGDVDTWVLSADVVPLEHYRTQATRWIRSYFGSNVADVEG